MKKILFVLTVLLTITTYAQEKERYLYAEIHDQVGPVANVNIINTRNKLGTFTTEEGAFRILAKPNDTLRISSVGYNTLFYAVKAETFGIKTTIITIIKTTIDLDEVTLKKNNLLGRLTSDTKHIKSEKQLDAKALKLPYAGSKIMTPAERRLHTAKTSGAGIPIDPLINLISGRLKKLKKLKEIEDLERTINNFTNEYSTYIINDLKIDKDDLYRFAHFCETDADFYINDRAGKIAMAQFLQKKAKEFIKLNTKTTENK